MNHMEADDEDEEGILVMDTDVEVRMEISDNDFNYIQSDEVEGDEGNYGGGEPYSTTDSEAAIGGNGNSDMDIIPGEDDMFSNQQMDRLFKVYRAFESWGT